MPTEFPKPSRIWLITEILAGRHNTTFDGNVTPRWLVSVNAEVPSKDKPHHWDIKIEWLIFGFLLGFCLTVAIVWLR